MRPRVADPSPSHAFHSAADTTPHADGHRKKTNPFLPALNIHWPGVDLTPRQRLRRWRGVKSTPGQISARRHRDVSTLVCFYLPGLALAALLRIAQRDRGSLSVKSLPQMRLNVPGQITTGPSWPAWSEHTEAFYSRTDSARFFY